jgi:hypothetical protein
MALFMLLPHWGELPRLKSPLGNNVPILDEAGAVLGRSVTGFEGLTKPVEENRLAPHNLL